MGNWEGTLKSRKVKTFENYWTVSHWPPPTLIFAFSLYKKLALKNPHKNIVFSPLGIATALASLSLGAKGKTLEEILERLKSNVTETTEADIHHSFEHLLQRRSHPGDQEQIGTGNALFVEKHLQILAEFKEKARALYQAEVFTADFQQPLEATKLINDYVSNQTQGKIKELVSELDESTSMVLVNYLLYRGESGEWLVSRGRGCCLGTCVLTLTTGEEVLRPQSCVFIYITQSPYISTEIYFRY
jgi:serine protease inhibitor